MFFSANRPMQPANHRIHKWARSAAMSALIVLACGGTAAAARVDFSNLDVKEGFAPKPTSRVPIGVIKSIKIGTTTIKSDWNFVGPSDGSTQQVAGILNKFYWAGAKTDAIQISFQVSPETQTTISDIIKASGSNIPVEIDLTVYQFDAQKRAYYKAVSADTVIKGLLPKVSSGADSSLSVTKEVGPIVATPPNVRVTLTLSPQPLEQKFNVGVGAGKNLMMTWGAKP